MSKDVEEYYTDLQELGMVKLWPVIPKDHFDRIGQLVKMVKVCIALLLLTLGVGIVGIAMRF